VGEVDGGGKNELRDRLLGNWWGDGGDLGGRKWAARGEQLRAEREQRDDVGERGGEEGDSGV